MSLNKPRCDSALPNHTPVGMQRSRVFNIEASAIQTKADVLDLINMMYHYPEDAFYYFQKTDGETSHLVNERHGILMRDIEFEFYKIPNFENYQQIIKRNGRYNSDWEETIATNGTVLNRTKLKLAEWKIREMEIAQKIETEKKSNSNPIELKPGICGFSVDLYKAWDFIKNLANKYIKHKE